MNNNKHVKRAAITVSAIMATSMVSPYVTAFADTATHTGVEHKDVNTSNSTFVPVLKVQRIKASKDNVRFLINYNFKNKDTKDLGKVDITNLHASPTSLKGSKLKVDVSYSKVRDGVLSVNFNMKHVRVNEFNPNMTLEYKIGDKEYNTPIKISSEKVNSFKEENDNFAVITNGYLPASQAPVILTASLAKGSNTASAFSGQNNNNNNNFTQYKVPFTFESKDGDYYLVSNFKVHSSASISYDSNVSEGLKKLGELQPALDYYNLGVDSLADNTNKQITSSSVGVIPVTTYYGGNDNEQNLTTNSYITFTVNGKNYIKYLTPQVMKLTNKFNPELGASFSPPSNSSNADPYSTSNNDLTVDCSFNLFSGNGQGIGLQLQPNDINSLSFRLISSNSEVKASIKRLTPNSEGVYTVSGTELTNIINDNALPISLSTSSTTRNIQTKLAILPTSATISKLKESSNTLSFKDADAMITLNKKLEAPGGATNYGELYLSGQNIEISSQPQTNISNGFWSQATKSYTIQGDKKLNSETTVYSFSTITGGQFINTIDGKSINEDKDIEYFNIPESDLSSHLRTKELLADYALTGHAPGVTKVTTSSKVVPNVALKVTNYSAKDMNSSSCKVLKGSYNVKFVGNQDNGNMGAIQGYTVEKFTNPNKEFKYDLQNGTTKNLSAGDMLKFSPNGEMGFLLLAPISTEQTNNNINNGNTVDVGGYYNGYSGQGFTETRGMFTDVNQFTFSGPTESSNDYTPNYSYTYNQFYLKHFIDINPVQVSNFNNIDDYSYAIDFGYNDIDVADTSVQFNNKVVPLSDFTESKTNPGLYYIPMNKIGYIGMADASKLDQTWGVNVKFTGVKPPDSFQVISAMVNTKDLIANGSSELQNPGGPVISNVNGVPYNQSLNNSSWTGNCTSTINITSKLLSTGNQAITSFNKETGEATLTGTIQNQTGYLAKYVTIEKLPGSNDSSIPSNYGDDSTSGLSFKLDSVIDNGGHVMVIPKNKISLFSSYFNVKPVNVSDIMETAYRSGIKSYEPGQDLTDAGAILTVSPTILPNHVYQYSYTGKFSGFNDKSIGYSGFNYGVVPLDGKPDIALATSSNINRFAFKYLMKNPSENVKIKVINKDTGKPMSATVGFENKNNQVVWEANSSNFNYNVTNPNNDYSKPIIILPTGYYNYGKPVVTKDIKDGVTNIVVTYNLTKSNPYTTTIRLVSPDGKPLSGEELTELKNNGGSDLVDMAGTTSTVDAYNNIRVLQDYANSTGQSGTLNGTKSLPLSSGFLLDYITVNGNMDYNAGEQNNAIQNTPYLLPAPYKVTPIEGAPSKLDYKYLGEYDGNNTIDVVVNTLPKIKLNFKAVTSDGTLIPGVDLNIGTPGATNTTNALLVSNGASVPTVDGIITKDELGSQLVNNLANAWISIANNNEGQGPSVNNYNDFVKYVLNMNNAQWHRELSSMFNASTPNQNGQSRYIITYNGNTYEIANENDWQYSQYGNSLTDNGNTNIEGNGSYDASTNTLNVNLVAHLVQSNQANPNIINNISSVVQPIVIGVPGTSDYSNFQNNEFKIQEDMNSKLIDNNLDNPWNTEVSDGKYDIPGFKLVAVRNNVIPNSSDNSGNIPIANLNNFNGKVSLNNFIENQLGLLPSTLGNSVYNSKYIYEQIGQYVKVNIHDLQSNSDINNIPVSLVTSNGTQQSSLVGEVKSGTGLFSNTVSTTNQLEANGFGATAIAGTLPAINGVKLSKLPNNLTQVGKPVFKTTTDSDGIKHTTITINVDKGVQKETKLVQKVAGGVIPGMPFNTTYNVYYTNGNEQTVNITGDNTEVDLEPYEIAFVIANTTNGAYVVSNNVINNYNNSEGKEMSEAVITLSNSKQIVKASVVDAQTGKLVPGCKYFISNTNRNYKPFVSTEAGYAVSFPTVSKDGQQQFLQANQFKSAKLVDVPKGYYVVKQPVITEKYNNNSGVEEVKVVAEVAKHLDSSVTTEVKENGKLIGAPVTVKGLAGKSVDVKQPVIPKGCSVVNPPTIPAIMPSKPTTLVWNVVKGQETAKITIVNTSKTQPYTGGLGLNIGKNFYDTIGKTFVVPYDSITDSTKIVPASYNSDFTINSITKTVTADNGNKVANIVVNVSPKPTGKTKAESSGSLKALDNNTFQYNTTNTIKTSDMNCTARVIAMSTGFTSYEASESGVPSSVSGSLGFTLPSGVTTSQAFKEIKSSILKAFDDNIDAINKASVSDILGKIPSMVSKYNIKSLEDYKKIVANGGAIPQVMYISNPVNNGASLSLPITFGYQPYGYTPSIAITDGIQSSLLIPSKTDSIAPNSGNYSGTSNPVVNGTVINFINAYTGKAITSPYGTFTDLVPANPEQQKEENGLYVLNLDKGVNSKNITSIATTISQGMMNGSNVSGLPKELSKYTFIGTNKQGTVGKTADSLLTKLISNPAGETINYTGSQFTGATIDAGLLPKSMGTMHSINFYYVPEYSEITTSVVDGNKVITPDATVTGKIGSKETYTTPNIPKGYHITYVTVNGVKTPLDKLPKEFNKTNTDIVWHISNHNYVTTINTEFVNKDGKTVTGGSWTVDGKIINGNSDTLKGIQEPIVKVKTLPNHYKLDGSSSVKTSIDSKGDKIVTVIQPVIAIPQTTVTTEIKEGNWELGNPTVVKGYVGDKDTAVIPTIPKGYHLVGETPNLPKTFQDKDVTVVWEVAHDSSSAKLAFTCDGKDIGHGLFNVNENGGTIAKVASQDGKEVNWCASVVNPFTFTVANVPTGYKLDGNIQVNKVIDKNGNVEYTVNQPLTKLESFTLTTKVMENGKLYNGESKSYTGFEGSDTNVAKPSIPNGYHLVGETPVIPKTFTKNETLIWNIAPNTTTIKVAYETKGGSIVSGGKIEIGGKLVTTTTMQTKEVEQGLVTPKITFKETPVGYKTVGSPVVKTVTVNGVRTITETQIVNKLPDNKVSVVYIDKGVQVGQPTVATGYEGETVTCKTPELPNGYHVVGKLPDLTTTIGDKAKCIFIPVAKDTTIINAKFINSDGATVYNGTMAAYQGKTEMGRLSTQKGSPYNYFDFTGAGKYTVTTTEAPMGYETVGKVVLTEVSDVNGNSVYNAVQKVKKIPDHTITVEYKDGNKVVGNPTVTTGYIGETVSPKAGELPKGYHLTGTSPKIPTVIGKTNTIIVIPVAQDTTKVVVGYTDESGNKLPNGYVTVDSSKLTTTGTSYADKTLVGLETPTIVFNGVPKGYSKVGTPKIDRTVDSLGNVTLKETQEVKRVSGSVTVKLSVPSDTKLDSSKTYTGYEYQNVNAVIPKAPKGYHLTVKPEIPKEFGSGNVTVTYIAVPDTCITKIEATSNISGVSYVYSTSKISGIERAGKNNVAVITDDLKGTFESIRADAPLGYKQIGQPTKTVKTTTEDNVITTTVTYTFDFGKMDKVVYKEQVQVQGGKVLNNLTTESSGYPNQRVDIAQPEIPAGYHLVSSESVPLYFGSTNETYTKIIAENQAVANINFVDKDGKVVKGGSFDIMGKAVNPNSDGITSESFSGTAIPSHISAKVVEVPTGYKLSGSIVWKSSVGKYGKVIWTGTQEVSKLPNHTITVEYTNGGNVIGSPEVVTGYQGQSETIKVSKVPKGYHVIGSLPKVPNEIGNDNVVVKIPVAKDMTTVNVSYETANDKIISGGIISVDGKDVTTTGAVITDVFNNTEVPTVKFTTIPTGYKSVGKPIVSVTTDTNDNKVYTEYQTVEKLADNSIVVEYTNNGKVVGQASTSTGYVGESVKVTKPTLPSGYHLTGAVPTIPTVIGNSNIVVKIPVAQDTTTVTAEYINSTTKDVVPGGTFVIGGVSVDQTNKGAMKTFDTLVTPKVIIGALPSGYRVDGSEKINTSTNNGVRTVTVVQEVSKIPDFTIKGEIICNGKVISSDSVTGQQGMSTKGLVNEPKVPTGYTIDSTPTIPGTFNKNETLTWKAVQDSTTIDVIFTNGKVDIAGGTVVVANKDGKTIKTITSTTKVATSDLGQAKVASVKVTGIPYGYKATGKPVITKSEKDGVTTISVTQGLTKIPSTSVKTEIVCNGKVLVNGETVKGLEGSDVNIKSPTIPNGYHLVGVAPKIPATFGSSDVTLIWNVSKNETIINEHFETSTGTIVDGGTWNAIDGKEVASNTYEGFINPIVSVKTLPSGYTSVGKVKEVTTVNKDGNRVIDATQIVSKIAEGKILTEVKCGNEIIGSINSYEGLNGTKSDAVAPKIPNGYKLVNITNNGKVVTGMPNDFDGSTQTLVWNVVKENPTFSNEIISNVKGATYKVTYADGMSQTITNAGTDVKLLNKKVKSISIVANPNNYEQLGKEGVANITIKGLNTNTQYVFNYNKIPMKYSNTIVTECTNGDITGVKYQVTYDNGSTKVFTTDLGSINDGTSQGVKQVKVLEVPAGYVETSGDLTNGITDNTSWTKGVFKFSKVNYSNTIQQSVEGSKVLPKVIYTVTYADGQIVKVSDSKTLDTLESKDIKSVEVTSVESGYELVKANPAVVSGSKSDIKTLFSFEYKKSDNVKPHKPTVVIPSKKGDAGSSTSHTVKPATKITDTTVTVKIVSKDGKELGVPVVVTGKPGAKDNLITPSAPAGYKIVSIVDNGKEVNSVPSTFTNDNQNVVITVEKENTPVIHHNDSNTAGHNTGNTSGGTSNSKHANSTGTSDSNHASNTGSDNSSNKGVEPIVIHHVNSNHKTVGKTVDGIINNPNSVIKGTQPITNDSNINNVESTTTNPKTGDSSNVPFAVGGIAALLGLIGVNTKRRKVFMNKKNNK